MRRKFISIILTIWVLLMMPMTAFAQSFDVNRLGSISVTLMDQDGKTPIVGAELSLYHVATVSLNSKNNLSYTFTKAFEDCGAALDDPSLSVKLDAFVKDHSVPADFCGTAGMVPGGLFQPHRCPFGGYYPGAAAAPSVPACLYLKPHVLCQYCPAYPAEAD